MPTFHGGYGTPVRWRRIGAALVLLAVAVLLAALGLHLLFPGHGDPGSGSAADGTDLTFSGAVNASWSSPAVPRWQCPLADTSVNGRYWSVPVTLNGQKDELDFDVPADYSGPGTYTFSAHPDSSDNAEGGLAYLDGAEFQVVMSGTVTFNRDERSGTIDAVMTAPRSSSGPTTTVTGRWACRQGPRPTPTAAASHTP